MGGWSYLLTKFTYKEWQYLIYWLTKYMNKNRNVNNGITIPLFHTTIISHNHPYINTMHCYLCRDGCVKCIHLRCGSCSCTLSASKTNTVIRCMWILLASSFIHLFLSFLIVWKKSFYSFFQLALIKWLCGYMFCITVL